MGTVIIESKEGINKENSYLTYISKIRDREHKYLCKLCGNTNITVKKYSESNIPLSCGCISKLKPSGKDFTGQSVFGILVYGYISESYWKVKYSCGHWGNLKTGALKNKGRKTSKCKTCNSKIPTTLDHGHAKRSGYSTEYTSWLNMRRRCEDDGHNRYEFYKGKGITYPEEWRDFNVFLKDMGHKPDTSYSIERLDRDAPYSKSNCVWASSKTQANNKSNNILIIKEGEHLPMSLKHWCDLESINYKNAHYRYKQKGESVEDILGVNYSLETP